MIYKSRWRGKRILPIISNSCLGMLRTPREEANSSKYPPMNPRATCLIGTTEVKKDFKPVLSVRELVRTVEPWVIAGKIALRGPGE